jgi:MoxR-like ATPase
MNRTDIQNKAAQNKSLNEIKNKISNLINNIKSVIYIDTKKLEYLLAAKIAGGHVLLADSHGVGKTSLARALAASIIWKERPSKAQEVTVDPFSRIQCTVDLLPQDILGYNRPGSSGKEFLFMKGPIFAHFVLCDEINLLTPKTQGSFFQAMEEKTITIEGKTYTLPDPFFIIATMNLKGAHLFPLPAPQLDRFMLQLSIGFPNSADEAEIIKQHGRLDGWKNFSPVVSSSELLKWQTLVDDIEIHPDIVDYIVACLKATRVHPEIVMGCSPRTGVKLSRLARALALVRGEDFVTIDHIQEIFIRAVAHRLIMKDSLQSAEKVLTEIVKSIPVDAFRKHFLQHPKG